MMNAPPNPCACGGPLAPLPSICDRFDWQCWCGKTWGVTTKEVAEAKASGAEIKLREVIRRWP